MEVFSQEEILGLLWTLQTGMAEGDQPELQ